MNGLLQDSRGLRERVMYEDIPSGNQWLLPILNAMKGNRVVKLEYQDYFDAEPREVLLEPYCVRVFRQRWYVIGIMENQPEGEEPSELTNQGQIRRYALDRILHLVATEETFKMPRQFSVESYFADAFGIIVEPEEYQVERIRLKVSDVNHRRQYLRSLPLHHSQRELERHSDYSVFEVRVAPTYDFVQQILAMGGEVEVLSPDYVRAEIVADLREICLHAVGILVVDDFEKFLQLGANLRDLVVGVGVEQDFLEQVVVLVEHALGNTHVALEGCSRCVLMLHDGGKDEGRDEGNRQRVGHRAVVLLEGVLVDVQAQLMMMAFSSESCCRLAKVGPNIG